MNLVNRYTQGLDDAKIREIYNEKLIEAERDYERWTETIDAVCPIANRQLARSVAAEMFRLTVDTAKHQFSLK